jgi:hypothetical protein
LRDIFVNSAILSPGVNIAIFSPIISLRPVLLIISPISRYYRDVGNRDCNVPTLGHHHSAEIYDDQSSQMDVIASTGVFERHCGVQLALIIIFHHYEPFRIGWLWFRCIPTISMILTILSYKLIEITEEVILGTLLGGTSQCNSSLELGGATLQDGMARSDFQWPGKPQGEIRSFSEEKRLIN